MNKARLAWDALKLPPGEELDCLVLEHFMGWIRLPNEQYPDERYKGCWIKPSKAWILCHNTLFGTITPDGSCVKPSSDTVKAIEIWDEIYQRRWSLVIGRTHDEEEDWFGRLEKEAGFGYSFVHGMSLGHVVCRAALTILLSEGR